MARVEATVEIAAPLADVWDLYFDRRRWAAWVDRFASVVGSEGYPETGGELVWRSIPAGRGEVRERVLAHEPRSLHRIEFEDPGRRASSRRASRSGRPARGRSATRGDAGARLPAHRRRPARGRSPTSSSSARRCAARCSARSATSGSRRERSGATHFRLACRSAAPAAHLRPQTSPRSLNLFVFKAAVVGAGTMGGEIAQAIAAADIDVVLKDVDQKFVDQGSRRPAQVTKGQLDRPRQEGEADPGAGRRAPRGGDRPDRGHHRLLRPSATSTS